MREFVSLPLMVSFFPSWAHGLTSSRHVFFCLPVMVFFRDHGLYPFCDGPTFLGKSRPCLLLLPVTFYAFTLEIDMHYYNLLAPTERKVPEWSLERHLRAGPGRPSNSSGFANEHGGVCSGSGTQVSQTVHKWNHLFPPSKKLMKH